MAARPFKGTAVSATKSARFRRVSPKITSAVTPAQSNAARLKAVNAAVRKGRPPNTPYPSYLQVYGRQRKVQAKLKLAQQAAYAKGKTAQSLRRLSGSNAAKAQAITRYNRATGRAFGLLGQQLSMRVGVSKFAGAVTKPQVVRVVGIAQSRNSSTAARLAQSIRATKANPARRGTKYKKGRGSSGSGKTAAPSINRRRKRTGMLPAKAVATPRAGGHMDHLERPDTGWITAGNHSGAENCAAVAIANHLLYHTGLRMTDRQVNELAAADETIPRMLSYLRRNMPFDNVRPYFNRLPVNKTFFSGDAGIVVYKTEYGVHAALRTLEGTVVSYGEELPLAYPVTEAWFIQWQTYRPSETH